MVNSWVEVETKFNKAKKEILLLMMIMIVMNMQNKLCATQFSYPLMTNSQPVPEQQLQNLEITNFVKFRKKFNLPDKRGWEPTEMRTIPAPQPRPVHTLSTPSMARSMSAGQPGLAVWPCSLPAPAPCSLNTGDWEKSLIS